MVYSQGLKGTTVTKYHANIRKALDYVVQTDLIPNNPVIKVGRLQRKTKNKSSYRTLPLFKEIEDKDFVCVDEMGNLRKPDYVSHKFKQILKNDDLRKIRFHDLRHSCATLLLKLFFENMNF